MITYKTVKAIYVQINNAEEWENDKLRHMYPSLAKQICEHKVSGENHWYTITGKAVEEWEQYTQAK